VPSQTKKVQTEVATTSAKIELCADTGRLGSTSPRSGKMHNAPNVTRLAIGIKNRMTTQRGSPAERSRREVMAVPIQMNGSARLSIDKAYCQSTPITPVMPWSSRRGSR